MVSMRESMAWNPRKTTPSLKHLFASFLTNPSTLGLLSLYPNRDEPWHEEFDGVVNKGYFNTLTSPAEIHHLDYFKYCSPSSSDKDNLHGRWLNKILPKIRKSRIQKVFDQHKRLAREWLEQTTERKEFWEKRADEEADAMEQQFDRKHRLSLQSNAVDQLDAQFQRYSKKIRSVYAPTTTDLHKGDRNDGDDGDNDEDDDTIEDLVVELEELISKSEPGFHPLIRALYHVVRGEPFERPGDCAGVSESLAFLYKFVLERLDNFSTLQAIEQKDMFVAISGIVDLDVHKDFPDREARISECRNIPLRHEELELLEKYSTKFVDQDDNDGILEADLTKLKAELERDLSRFMDGTAEKILIEILLILVKLSLPDIFKRPKATEASTLFIWHAIWQALFAQTAISVQVGETILKEARVDQLLVRQIVGPTAAKGAAGASGRRLDFRLTACVEKAQESISVTVCNNEHKEPSVSPRAAALQHRKNTRLNKSILTRGLTPPSMPTVFCDVVGLEGRMYVLKPFNDAWLTCEVNEPIKLPTNSFEMGVFIRSNQLKDLLAYRKLILSFARKCQGFASNPPAPGTPTYPQRSLPTFYTPTVPRTKDVL
ncbi:hypothetical protein BGX34_000982 [Mortierella sp. NVP85]|nr:hypothetical protein BGX34_000982 [Mortierella sp. NVP85]